MEGNRAKEESKKEMFEFSKRKWEEEMEEKRRQSRVDEEQKKGVHEVELIRAKTERAIARTTMIKSLSDLGLSPEEILEQLKDL